MGCCSSRELLRPSHHASERSLVPPDINPSQQAPHPTSHPLAASPAHHALHPRLPLNQRFNQPIQRAVKPWQATRPKTKREIDRDRVEFWDTRVTGREEIWRALRMVVEMMEYDLQTAQEIVNASGITVPTGDLTKGVYDEQGNVYLIPKFCLSYPTNCVAEEEEGRAAEAESTDTQEMTMEVAAAAFNASLDIQKGQPLAADPSLALTARLSDNGGHDVQIHFNANDTVRIICARIAEKENIELGSTKLTMAYLGKILNDDQTLSAQGWKQGHIVNILIRPQY